MVSFTWAILILLFFHPKGPFAFCPSSQSKHESAHAHSLLHVLNKCLNDSHDTNCFKNKTVRTSDIKTVLHLDDWMKKQKYAKKGVNLDVCLV